MHVLFETELHTLTAWVYGKTFVLLWQKGRLHNQLDYSTTAAAYSNKTIRRNLCLSGKLHIIRTDKKTLLSEISEIVSKMPPWEQVLSVIDPLIDLQMNTIDQLKLLHSNIQ